MPAVAVTDRRRLAVELALLGLLACMWGSSYLFIRIALESLPPLTVIAARVSVAGTVLLTILWLTGGRLPRDRHTWWLLLRQAMLISICAWALLAWGQQYVASGLASVLNSTAPIFVFFLTVFVTRHEATDNRKLLGACLGVCGVTLIVGVDVLAGLGQQVLAQLAILLSAIMYGGAAIHGKRYMTLPPLVTAAGTMVWSIAVMVPASLIVEAPWTLEPTVRSLVAAGCLGLFCTAVALLLYFRLVRTLGSMGVASQGYLRAGVGVALGVIILGETITPVVAAGVAIALVGVAVINWPSRAVPDGKDQ